MPMNRTSSMEKIMFLININTSIRRKKVYKYNNCKVHIGHILCMDNNIYWQ